LHCVHRLDGALVIGRALATVRHPAKELVPRRDELVLDEALLRHPEVERLIGDHPQFATML
jgi:hypothetical protein